jgi:uncharacterized protein (DUF433 family)
MADEQTLMHRIVVSRDTLHGQPRIAGTRILVQTVLQLLAAGKSVTEITSDDYYPDISPDDVFACIGYASQIVRQEIIVPTT